MPGFWLVKHTSHITNQIKTFDDILSFKKADVLRIPWASRFHNEYG